MAIGTVADCGRDAAAALIAKGALQHVRSYLASGYTGTADANNGASYRRSCGVPTPSFSELKKELAAGAHRSERRR